MTSFPQPPIRCPKCGAPLATWTRRDQLDLAPGVHAVDLEGVDAWTVRCPGCAHLIGLDDAPPAEGRPR